MPEKLCLYYLSLTLFLFYFIALLVIFSFDGSLAFDMDLMGKRQGMEESENSEGCVKKKKDWKELKSKGRKSKN